MVVCDLLVRTLCRAESQVTLTNTPDGNNGVQNSKFHKDIWPHHVGHICLVPLACKSLQQLRKTTYSLQYMDLTGRHVKHIAALQSTPITG